MHCFNGSAASINRTPLQVDGHTVLRLTDNYFQSGSASLAYSQWTGSAWTPEVTLSASIAEAAVFGGVSTTDSIKPSGTANPLKNEFGEAGLDLTAATGGLGSSGRPCEQFGTVFGESRSSGSSTTAQMKDLVGPLNMDISNCATPSLTTTQQPASGAMGDTFKDKATISGLNTPDGTGSITFKLYSAADCGGSVLDAESLLDGWWNCAKYAARTRWLGIGEGCCHCWRSRSSRLMLETKQLKSGWVDAKLLQ